MNKYTRQNICKGLLIGIPAFLIVIAFGFFSFYNIILYKKLGTVPWYVNVADAALFILGVIYIKRVLMFILGDWGEVSIESVLSDLPKDSKVLRNLVLVDEKDPTKKSNIDFLVVDSHGIVIIEVKSHRGKIEFKEGRLHREKYGFKIEPIKQVRGQMAGLLKILKKDLNLFASIQPIIVFADKDARFTFGEKPLGDTGVIVVRSKWLKSVITSRSGYQNQERVERIYQCLKKYVEE